MKHRNAKPARKSSSTKPVVKKPALRVVDRSNTAAIRGCLAERGDLLTPLLELIVNAKASIDELMTDAARGMVEQQASGSGLLLSQQASGSGLLLSQASGSQTSHMATGSHGNGVRSQYCSVSEYQA